MHTRMPWILYTYDSADDLLFVEIVGRSITKKIKLSTTNCRQQQRCNHASVKRQHDITYTKAQTQMTY